MEIRFMLPADFMAYAVIALGVLLEFHSRNVAGSKWMFVN